MKSIIVLAFVVIAANALMTPPNLTDEQKDKINAHFKVCAQQENLSKQEIDMLRSKDIANPTRNMKCFGACFLERAEILKDGALQQSIVMEKLAPLYGEERAAMAIQNCKDTVTGDRCETGYNLFKCFEATK